MSKDQLNPQLFKQAQSMQRNLLKLREEMKERNPFGILRRPLSSMRAG